jgi:hypothetical protein
MTNLTNDSSVSSETAVPPTSTAIPVREFGVSNELKNIPESEEIIYGDGIDGRPSLVREELAN